MDVKLSSVVVFRRMATDKVTAIIFSKTLEVSLCSAIAMLSGGSPLPDLENYLLYSGAALAQQNKHASFVQEPGYSSE